MKERGGAKRLLFHWVGWTDPDKSIRRLAGCTVNVLKGRNGAKYPVYSLSKLHYLYFIPRRLFKQVKASVCITLPVCTTGKHHCRDGLKCLPTEQTYVKVRNIRKL